MSVHRSRRARFAIALVLALFVAGLVILVFTPLLDSDLESRPEPAADYASAMAKAAQLMEADGAEVDPRCRSKVLSQGEAAARSVVLLHGYTNCPQQFDVMARAYADAGYNVVVARLPQHGLSDRLTGALSDLDPGQLTALGDSAVDIAAGLGDEVTVVGLSGGGTLAAWLAAERDDVAQAILMAPLMVPKVLPEILAGPVARVGTRVPDFYLWWNGELKQDLASPPYAYPRYSIRSLAAFLAVGRRAHGSVDRTTELDRLVIVTNENDAAVSNRAVQEVADALGEVAATRVDHVFAEESGYRHDIVDPQGENATDLPEIYAVLGELLGLPNLVATLQSGSTR